MCFLSISNSVNKQSLLSYSPTYPFYEVYRNSWLTSMVKNLVFCWLNTFFAIATRFNCFPLVITLTLVAVEPLHQSRCTMPAPLLSAYNCTPITFYMLHYYDLQTFCAWHYIVWSSANLTVFMTCPPTFTDTIIHFSKCIQHYYLIIYTALKRSGESKQPCLTHRQREVGSVSPTESLTVAVCPICTVQSRNELVVFLINKFPIQGSPLV